MGNRFLAEIVSGFVERYPEVEVEMVLTGRLVDLVAEHFDVALRAGKMADSSLVARKVSASDLALFASDDYLVRRGEPRTLAELATHECVLFRPQNRVNRWRLMGKDGEEEVEVRGRTSADDFGFVRDLVRAGAGIGLVPALLLPDGLHEKKRIKAAGGKARERDVTAVFSCANTPVRRVLPEYVVRGASLHVVYPNARHVPAKVAAFRDYVIDAYARFPLGVIPD
jgi:DNA-binding transcriptional LysR family regulator